MDTKGLEFSTLDAPTQPCEQTYAQPLEEWNRLTATAQALAQREAEMPLRRRVGTFLTEANRATLII